MGSESFWFVDKRVQTNNLKRWFIYVVLLITFVSVAGYFCIKTMYSPFKNYYIRTQEMKVTVEESRKTNMNGYIKGTITNNQETDLKDKYMKFAFYTKNEVNLGNEYIEIGTIKSNETKTYQLDYKYSNVDLIFIMIVDSKE